MTEKAVTPQPRRVYPPYEIKKWWEKLNPLDPANQKPGDRAILARLRHCQTVIEAMSEPAFPELVQNCGVEHGCDLERVALAMAVMSYVRSDIPGKKNARIIGPTEQSDGDDASSALCKPLRFRQLLGASTIDECYRVFRQLVNLMGRTVNVDDLVKSLWNWPRFPGSEKAADQIRVKWVYDYWSVGGGNKSDNNASQK
ncbi:type I-E CRISPR-associated protein Cse2/CasB [Aristophania vespae]|uniref:type I-E CRISPR-associated protein Cse2/CasB n=1 Tax=Aristophania vespae TaxID=2697033 RepID=UPI002351B9B1|nr:type I-E CRISPR-associated protein Cse2/CasB [Aristophania vespae]UMM64418.1 hypothetical protein DM15PD_14320 [Aristophania vespae]